VRHDGFARLQQQTRQVAVDKRNRFAHLFNILNDFANRPHGGNPWVRSEMKKGAEAPFVGVRSDQ
jgi:hypothetical protein